jgi:Flp pilus assembly protein TadB
MPIDQRQSENSDDVARLRVRAPGPLGKALAFAIAAILLVVALVFSLMIVAIVAVGALMVWGYLWWKTRELRRQLRERAPDGRVIEGELTSSGDNVPGEAPRSRRDSP